MKQTAARRFKKSTTATAKSYKKDTSLFKTNFSIDKYLSNLSKLNKGVSLSLQKLFRARYLLNKIRK